MDFLVHASQPYQKFSRNETKLLEGSDITNKGIYVSVFFEIAVKTTCENFAA
jgi:hypothetical protein